LDDNVNDDDDDDDEEEEKEEVVEPVVRILECEDVVLLRFDFSFSFVLVGDFENRRDEKYERGGE
jgi:hypothetical protein